MSRRKAVHVLSVLALTAPTAAAVVLGGATSAFAAAAPATFDSSSPTSGQAFTGSPSSVTVSATLPACTKQSLSNSCASGTSVTATLSVTSAKGQNAGSVTKTSSSSGPQSLSVTVPAGLANDVWTATLTGATNRSFTVNEISEPSSFSAEGSGAQDVTFTWTKNTEADLTGYTLADSNGSIIDDSITNSSANCASSSRCSYGLYYPSANPGSHGYQLVAKRPAATSGTLTSSPNTANATLTTPPKPTPSATPSPSPGATSSPDPGGTGGSTTGGGGNSGSTGGTSGNGSTGGSTANNGSSGTIATGPKPTLPPAATNPVIAQRRAFALTFNAFSPSLGIPKLPPLPATDLPSISGEQPLPLGTYKPSLPYQGQNQTTMHSVLSSPTAFVENITDSAQLAQSIAAALILLLIGGHLRRYIGSHVED